MQMEQKTGLTGHMDWKKSLAGFGKNIRRDKALLIIIAPVIIYFIVFHYLPMCGIVIAFKKFVPGNGLFSGDWVGFKNFSTFFNSVYFGRLMKNTLLLSIYGLLWGFPVPILFALFINELKNGWYKRLVQTVSYLPHFISVVVIVGMLVNFLSVQDGVVNVVIRSMGYEPVAFMNESRYFRTLYIGSGIWQEFGWNSIIYLAALSSIDPQLYEASRIDGAGRFRQLLSITLPGIMPTIIILFILSLGSLMSVGYEKIILMYNPATYDTADVIATYTYRRGILGGDYSFGTAVGLFNSAINFLLLMVFNSISKRISQVSLW